MRAVLFNEYGGPDVLHVGEAAEPHAGAGQVRVAVGAVGVNPIDWKVRSGAMAQFMPVEFPSVPGEEAAGVVDEVGDGVDDVAVGDEGVRLRRGRRGGRIRAAGPLRRQARRADCLAIGGTWVHLRMCQSCGHIACCDSSRIVKTWGPVPPGSLDEFGVGLAERSSVTTGVSP